jgi:hypothetical protein
MFTALCTVSVVGVITAIAEYYGRKADQREKDRIKQFDSDLRGRVKSYVSAS